MVLSCISAQLVMYTARGMHFTCRLHRNYGFESRLASIWRNRALCVYIYIYARPPDKCVPPVCAWKMLSRSGIMPAIIYIHNTHFYFARKFDSRKRPCAHNGCILYFIYIPFFLAPRRASDFERKNENKRERDFFCVTPVPKCLMQYTCVIIMECVT